MRAVEERRDALVLQQAVVALMEPLEAVLVEGADRFAQVPKDLRVAEVERLGVPVLQYPGEHRVLREVAVRAAGQRVEEREVVKVGHVAGGPALGGGGGSRDGAAAVVEGRMWGAAEEGAAEVVAVRG